MHMIQVLQYLLAFGQKTNKQTNKQNKTKQEYSKLDMLQDHDLKCTLLQEHAYYMTQCAFKICSWSIFDLEYSSRLLKWPMVFGSSCSWTIN